MAQPPITNTGAGAARRYTVGQARAQLRRLALQIGRALKLCDADAVHDVRVAIRRFTRAIAVCQPYVRATDMGKNRRRLKKMMTEAGEVRDCDVALKLIAKLRVPQTTMLRLRLQGRRRQSAIRLCSELKKWRDRRKSLRWSASLRSGKEDAAEESIQEVGRRVLARGMKDFLEQGKEASSGDASAEDLHRFRITAKKFRYSIELFQPLYGSKLDPVIQSIKGASALLGDINDSVSAAALIAKYDGGERLAHRLKKRQHKATEEFREYWKELKQGGTLDLTCIEPAAPKKPVASTEHRRRKSVA